MASHRHRWAIRAASSPGDGAGHLHRCLALADALADNGDEALMVLGPEPGPLADVPRAQGHQVRVLQSHDADELSCALREIRPDGLIVDGYRFDDRLQAHWQEVAPVRLTIDDLVRPCRVADIVLNQNLGHRAEEYAGLARPDATLLLGVRYALLRREWRHTSAHPIRRQADRLVLMMGAEDTRLATEWVIRALERIPQPRLEVAVVVGHRCQHLESIERASAAGRHHYDLVRHPASVADLMRWADLGIIACGSTAWECLAAGLPMVAFPVAENQRRAAEEIRQADLGVVLPPWGGFNEERMAAAIQELLGDAATRRRMSEAGRRLVDGQGARRVARALHAGRPQAVV